ncbi:pentapeptide repeat-containing protein [Protofrankia symbiont of Coriaria ruscifolia]|nr:pentapeptide repeat-containing protein [Protofrankia symbiont of Coriaria ruscifolia]
MTGLGWVGGRLRDVTVDDCRLDLANFRGTKMTRTIFSGCNLKQADFQNADISGVIFEDCDLTGVTFSGANMEGTRIIDSALVGIRGVDSMRGAAVASRDLVALAYSLARALDINIIDS